MTALSKLVPSKVATFFDELREPSATPTLPGYARLSSPPRRILKDALLLSLLSLVCFGFGFLFAILPPSFYIYLAAPVAAAMLFAIWALPKTEKPLPRVVRFFFFGFLISLSVWPNYLALALPGLPWITSNRLFTYPLLIAFLISLSVSDEFKGRIKAPLATVKPATIALIIFVALQFLSIGFSDMPAQSAVRFVNSHISFTMVFFISIWIFSYRQSLNLFLPLCMFFCFYQAGLGLGEYFTQSIFWAPWVPGFLKGGGGSDAYLVAKILAGTVRSAVGTHRTQGIFTTSLSYAEFLGILQPFMLHALFFGRKLIYRALGAVGFFAALAGIILSQSRLGLVATIVGLLLFSLFMSLRLWRLHRNSLLPPAIILAYPFGAVAFIALTLVWNRLSNMVWGGGEAGASNASRMEQYSTGIYKVLQWPFGYGMGNSGKLIGMIGPDGSYNIDTYYVLLSLDSGPLSLFCYAFLFLYVAYKAALISINRPSNDKYNTVLIPASCALVAFFVIKSVLSQEDTHSFVFIILGLAVAAIHHETRKKQATF